MNTRPVVALLAALYLLAVIVAVLAYPKHVLTYGAASWCGGVLFVIGLQSFRKMRSQR